MYVYKITNSVTGKSYVGITTLTVAKRFSHHKYAANCLTRDKNSYLYNSIRKHGIDVFFVEQLQECKSLDELNKAESEQILKHNTLWPNGYNLKGGGDYAFLTEDVRKKLSDIYKEKIKKFGVDPRAIAALQKTWKKNCKVVIARNIKTNQEIEFESIISTERSGFNHKVVNDVLTGKKKTYRGYYWYYKLKGFSLPVDKTDACKKPLKAIDLQTNQEYYFESLSSLKKFGFSPSGICSSIKDKREHKGYFWSYISKDEYLKQSIRNPIIPQYLHFYRCIETKEDYTTQQLRDAGFLPGCVTQVCFGEKKTHKGFTWQSIVKPIFPSTITLNRKNLDV